MNRIQTLSLASMLILAPALLLAGGSMDESESSWNISDWLPISSSRGGPRKLDANKARAEIERRSLEMNRGKLMERQKRLQEKIQADDSAQQAEPSMDPGMMPQQQLLPTSVPVPVEAIQNGPMDYRAGNMRQNAMNMPQTPLVEPPPPPRGEDPEHPGLKARTLPVLPVIVPHDGAPTPEGLTVQDQDAVLVDEETVRTLEASLEPAAAPPAPEKRRGRLLQRGHVQVDGDRDGGAHVTGTYQVSISEKSYHIVPLNLGTALLLQATLGGNEVLVTPDGSAILQGPLEGELELRYSIAPSPEDEQRHLDLSLPDCPLVAIEGRIPRTGLLVEATGLAGLVPGELADAKATTFRGHATGNAVQLRWWKRPQEGGAPIVVPDSSEPSEPVAAPEEEKARVDGWIHSEYSLADTLLTARTSVQLDNITQPGISQVTLRLSDRLELIEVTEEGSTEPLRRQWQPGKDGWGNLVVLLPAKRTKKLNLVVVQKRIEPLAATMEISLPPVIAVDLTKVHTSGSFQGPSDGANIEIDCGGDGSGIEELDVSKIDARFSRTTQPLDAWRYETPPGPSTPMVVETLTRRGKYDLQKFEMPGMQLDTMLTSEKVALTRARLKVINSDRQFLEITLPPTASLQSAFVRNRPVKPGVKDDKVLVIPLVRSAGKAFLVEITYTQEIPLFEIAGQQRITALKVDGRINRLDWRVYFPERYLVKEWFVGKGLRSVPAVGYSDHVEDISREVQGQNAFGNQRGLMQSAVQPRGAAGSGALPVRLPFPTCERGLSFEKIVLRENDDQLILSFVNLERRLFDYAVDLLIALSFMCSAGIFYARARGASVSGPLIGTLGSLALLLAAREVFPNDPAGQRSIAIGIAAAIGLLFLHLLFYPVRRMLAAALLFLALAAGDVPAAPVPAAVVPYEEDGLAEALENPSASTLAPHALRTGVEERLEELKKAATAAAAPPTEQAPVGFLILEGDVEGHLEGSIARLQFLYRVQVLNDGWHRIPLISGDLTVSKVTIDGQDGEVIVEETRDLINQEYTQNENALSNLSDAKTQLMNVERTIPFHLLVNGKGTHEIRFEGEASVQESAGRHRLTLHPPLFPRGDLDLHFAAKGLNVQLNGQNLATSSGDDTRLTAPVGTQRPLVVEWTERASQMPEAIDDLEEEAVTVGTTPGPSPAPGATPTPAVTATPTPVAEKPALIVADTVSQITLDGTSLSGSTFFILNIHVSGVESLSFDCPPGLTFYKVTEVGAPGGQDRVTKFKRESGGKTGLVVSFRKKVKGPITLAMTYDLPYGAESEKKKELKVGIPSIVCREAHVQAGVLGIEREGAVEMSEVAHAGLDVLEPDQLPERIAQFMTTPARFAYRYHSPGWTLDLAVRKHEHESLASAVITHLNASTRMHETGFVTEVTYVIRNNGNPHVALWLPARTKPVRCRVDNQDIQPDVGKDGGLEISLGSKGPDQLVTLHVEYEEVASGEEGKDEGGTRTLELPRTSFAVTGSGLTWEVNAPPGSFVLATGGDLKPRREGPYWNEPGAWVVKPPREATVFESSLVLWSEAPQVTVTTGSRRSWMLTCALFAVLGMVGVLFLGSGLAWAHAPFRSLPRLIVPAAVGLGAIALEPNLPGATAGVFIGTVPGMAMVIMILFVQLARRFRGPSTGTVIPVTLLLALAPSSGEAQVASAPAVAPATAAVTVVTPASPATVLPDLPGYQEIGRIFLVPRKESGTLLSGPGARIILGRSELEQLFDLGSRPVLPPLKATEPGAPVEHLILSGVLEGREDGGKLRFQGRYRVRSHVKGVLELGFDPGEISVTSLTVDGAPAALLPAAGGGLPGSLQLLADEGLHQVEIRFTLNVDRRQDVSYLQMQIPSCPDTELKLDIPDVDSVASVVPSTHLSRTTASGRLILSTHLKYGKTFFAQWQRPIREEAIEPAGDAPDAPVVEEAPVYEANVAQNAHLDSGRLEIRAMFEVPVRAGSLSSLRLEHPDTFRVADISGSEVAGWQPDRAGGTRVSFRSKMRGAIQLNLHGMTMVTSSGDATREIKASLPRLGVEGAQGQKGQIRLVVPADEDLREDQVVGLVRTDAGDPAAAANNQAGQRIYQYVGADYALDFRLIRHPVIKVPSTRIPQGTVTLFVPPKGAWFGLASYQVQNNTRQFLRLELPPRSQLLSCFVDGKPSQPSKVVDPGHEDNPYHPIAYLIPLARSRVTDGVMSQFPIDLAYISLGQPGLVSSGELALALPVADLSVDRLRVGLALPPGILTSAEHPSLLPVWDSRQEASLSRILARTLKMEDVPQAGKALAFTLALPFAPLVMMTAGQSRMMTRSAPMADHAMSKEAWVNAPKPQSAAAPAMAPPGAFGGAAARRGRRADMAYKTEKRTMSENKLQAAQEIASLEGAISDELDAGADDSYSVDAEFEEQAMGSNMMAEPPAPQESLQVPSQQDFTRLLEGARTKKGALPVRVEFDTRGYRVSWFEVVLHEGVQPGTGGDAFSGGSAFDRPQPLTVNYVDMRLAGPILALFFLILPAYLLSLAFGPGAGLGRRLGIFVVAVLASLAASSLELWGLATFGMFKAGIVLGALALPVLHLIRTTAQPPAAPAD